MTKREALAVLIQHSALFSDDLKKQLLSSLETLPEGDVSALGTLLAQEKQNEWRHADSRLSFVEAVLQEDSAEM